MKKLLLAGLVSISSLMAENYTILPYAGYLDYSGSTTKKDGVVGGVYISATNTGWKTEIDVEGTKIFYNDNTSPLKQLDTTLLVTKYDGYNLEYTLGLHHINTTDSLTDTSNIFILKGLYYQMYKYNFGADVFYSRYNNLSTSPKIFQVSPKGGFNFGNYRSLIGSFYLEGKVDYIKPLTNKDANNLKSSYTSFEANLNNYNLDFTTTIGFWVGKRAYAVENGGFIVNNIGDEQKGGFKFSESYAIDKTQSIKFEYTYTKFEENGDSHSNVFVLSYSNSF